MTGTNTVTMKDLAASLADEHQMSKRAGRAMLDDLVGLITKHLKKGERIRISGLGIFKSASERLAWVETPQPARQ